MNSDAEENIRNTCEKVFEKYSEERVKEAFELMIKLLNNIINKPTENKFRQFKKTNETIKAKIIIMKENLDILKAIGYEDIDSEIMAFQGQDLTNVKAGVRVLGDYMEVFKKILAEKEYAAEIKRQEEIKRFNEDIQKKHLAEKMRQNKIKEQLENDKKEREKKEKPTESKANALSYGAKVCKFEPKKGGGGG